MKRRIILGLIVSTFAVAAAAAQQAEGIHGAYTGHEETHATSASAAQKDSDAASAAQAAQKEYRWNASLALGGSRSGGDGMGGIGAEIMREFGRHLEIGFRAYAQAEVSTEYEDSEGRGYHMSSGYGTLVIKPKVSLGERVEIGFPLETGNGLLQYRYNGEYREELRWSEEILDQVNHSVYSAGIEPKFFFGGHNAVTLAAGYLVTGPLRTDLADNGELNGFWARLGYSLRF